MQPLHFFLGANSEEGFFSLYDQLLGGRLDDLMILKGGPGCGKSTFMRRVGAAMERAGAHNGPEASGSCRLLFRLHRYNKAPHPDPDF